MALELMQQADHRPRDVTAIPLYREEGHDVADSLIARCRGIGFGGSLMGVFDGAHVAGLFPAAQRPSVRRRRGR